MVRISDKRLIKVNQQCRGPIPLIQFFHVDNVVMTCDSYHNRNSNGYPKNFQKLGVSENLFNLNFSNYYTWPRLMCKG